MKKVKLYTLIKILFFSYLKELNTIKEQFLLWKLIGNSVYGQLGIGLNLKLQFDARVGQMRYNNPGVLANPIVAQAVSGLCRGLLSSLIQEVNKMEGKIVSCTY